MLQNTKVFYLTLISLIFIIGTWLFYPLTIHGIGTAFDSISYLGTAENIVKGRGFLNFDGRPYSNWPPLYPLLLTPIYLIFHGEVLVVGIVINVIGYLITAVLLWKILQTAFGKSYISLLGILLGLGSVFSLVSFHNMISETYYVVFTLLYILFLHRYLTSSKTKDFILLIIAAWLCTLQRYVGVVPIGIGCISLLLVSQGSLLKRLLNSFVFGFLSILPLIAWLLRNIITTATVTGADRTTEVKYVKYNLVNAIQQTWQWFWPYYERSGFVFFAALGLFIFIGGLTYFLWRERKNVSSEILMLFLSFSHTITYIIFMTYAAIVQSSSAIDARLSAPAFFTAVPLFCFILYRSYLSTKQSKFCIAVYLLAVITLIYTYQRSYTSWKDALAIGEGVSSLRWKKSDLLSYLRTTEGKEILSKGNIYCSPPEVLYFYGFGSFKNVVQEHKKGILNEAFTNDPSSKTVIWFDSLSAFNFFLQANAYPFKYKQVKIFKDGVIFQLPSTLGTYKVSQSASM